MIKITVKDLLENTDSKLLIGDESLEINECFVDSRKVKEGSCFFGVEGKKENGSVYYKEAFLNGASIVVINKMNSIDLDMYKDKTIVLTNNVLKVLHDIAIFKRSLFKGKVIGITGSVGKTTTRKILVSILKNKYKVLTNNGNENGQLGVPLTILRLKDEDVIALEMGVSMKGEMNKLSKIARPNISLITNICESHIANFNSKEDILNAKLEIINGMDKGTLYLNNDDSLLNNLKIYDKNINTITYGIKNESDYMVNNLLIDNDINFDFCMINDIKLNVPYSYIYNFLGPILISKEFNISNDDIYKGIYNYKNEHHRLEIINLDNNITMIDDTYNANLKSVKASIEFISKYDKRKIFVLGDILELGKISKKTHQQIGYLLKNSNIDILITIGKYSKYTGKKCKNIWNKHFYNEKDSREYIKKLLKEDDVILLKGSNGMNLVNIVDDLKKYFIFQ